MASGTHYRPTRNEDLDSTSVNFAGKGVTTTVPGNATTNVDTLISDDAILTGMIFWVNGFTAGDTVTFQVVDKDNVLGFGAGVVLNEFVTAWSVPPSGTIEHSPGYPAKIITGLYMRVKYTATGGGGIFGGGTQVGVNYELHKIVAP